MDSKIFNSVIHKSAIAGRPKVTVCVVTFNQEKVIRQCLQSIMEQTGHFELQVIVSDDHSTDGTVEILKEFAREYPGSMELILGEINVGPFENFKRVHRRAAGEYVAHVDGDDYMLPGKLEQQLFHLDANPQHSMTAHRMAIEKSGKISGRTREVPETVSLSWLILNHPAFLNSSMMYRRSLVGDLLNTERDFIDFYSYVHFAKQGSIGFVNKALGVYRASVGISYGLKLMPLIQDAIDAASAEVKDPTLICAARFRQYRSYALASLCRNGEKEANIFAKSMLINSTSVADRLLSRAILAFPLWIKSMLLTYKFMQTKLGRA